MFNKYKKVIIIILVVILLFLVWSIFINDEPEIEPLLVTRDSEEVGDLGEKIIKTLNRVNKIELNKAVFEHPVFLRLEDYSREIQKQDVGRENPFEPFNASDSAVIQEPQTPLDNEN